MFRFFAPSILVVCATLATPLRGQAPRPTAVVPPLAPEYRIDAGHSRVEFSIPFMYLPVRGRFNDVRGTVLYDPAHPERSSVSAVIDARSIDTGSAHRDEHLRSADFFDAERFPTLVFQSRRVRRAGGALLMTGPLTMHGATREVTIRFRPLAPPASDPHGSSIVVFSGDVRLNRKDFGITGGSRFNPWFDAVRSATMGDSVQVRLEVSGWATDWTRKRDAGVDSSIAHISRDGVAAATARVRSVAARDSAAISGAEGDIDQVGAALLARGRAPDALEVLKLNAELFPRSSAARASLAAAYERQGAGDGTAEAPGTVARAGGGGIGTADRSPHRTDANLLPAGRGGAYLLARTSHPLRPHPARRRARVDMPSRRRDPEFPCMNGLRIARPPDTAAPLHADAAARGSGATFVSAGTSDFARWFAPLLPLLSRWRWVLHAEPHVYRFPDEWYREWDEARGAWAGPELERAERLVLDERDDWRLVEGEWLQSVAGTLLDDWADFYALREPLDDLGGFLEQYWAADTPEAAHDLLETRVALHFSCVDGAVWEVHAADPALLDAVRQHLATLPAVRATESSLMQSLRRYEPHA